MYNILLVGAGGHAKSCVDVIEKEKKYKILGLIDKNTNKKNIFNYPIINENDIDNTLLKKAKNVLIAVGQIKTSNLRIKLFNKYKKLGFRFPVIKSPNSYISKYSKISDGTIIMHHVIINASVTIGQNCIINNKSLIDHDTIIGDYNHISTGAILNGGVNLGNNCFIGSGSVINQDIVINNNCVVGSGLVVKKNIIKNSIIKK